MPDIIITEFMDDGPVADLAARFEVLRDDGLWGRPEALAAAAGHAVGLIVRNKTQVDTALLDAAPDLKVVGRLGVGLDNIDSEACAARGIAVCPATGANAAAVAEYVVASTLLLLRGTFGVTAEMIAGDWPRGDLGHGREAGGRTLGLIGFGNIGQETARRAAALGMNVLAHDPGLADDDPAWGVVERAEFDAVIARADVISLHVPLIGATRNLISHDTIGAMKPGAILINTARGGIVDEAAVADALRCGQLGGAALDVFTDEPPGADHLACFGGLTNVILTPHIAGLTGDANARVARATVDNVLRVLGDGGQRLKRSPA